MGKPVIFAGAWSAVLIALCLSAVPTSAKAATGMSLGTKDEQELDRRSLQIMKRPDFQEGVRNLEAIFRADPMAKQAAASASIPNAAAVIAYQALQSVIGSDPDRPAFMWSGDAPHSWFGMDIPWASYGFNNQDDIYQLTGIDPHASYEISGRWMAERPVQIRFGLFKSDTEELPAGLDGGTVVSAADGTFRITVDSEPANGRPNHIQVTADTAHLIVRSMLSDWATQTPPTLSIRRVAGPPVRQPPSDAAISAEAIARATTMTHDWLEKYGPMAYKPPANTVAAPFGRVGGWGYLTMGHFDLGPDQALVVTLDPAGAAYVGFELGDAWAISLEFVHHTSSLASGQVKANRNGTITYVIAATDPGVFNWLDAEGLSSATFAIRWQKLAANASLANAVRSAEVVKLADLREHLPADTAWVTPSERRAQIEERTASWNRRLQ